MNVDGEDVRLQQHWGSEYTMVDHRNKSYNFYLNAIFIPSPKIKISTFVNFNGSIAELDEVEMPDITARLAEDDYDGHQIFDYPYLHTYGHLEYQLIRTSLNLEYLVSSGVTFTIGVDYADLKDKSGEEWIDVLVPDAVSTKPIRDRAGYVYGDETGTYLLFRSGIRFDL